MEIAVLDNPAVVLTLVDKSATLVKSCVDDCCVEISILVRPTVEAPCVEASELDVSSVVSLCEDTSVLPEICAVVPSVDKLARLVNFSVVGPCVDIPSLEAFCVEELKELVSPSDVDSCVDIPLVDELSVVGPCVVIIVLDKPVDSPCVEIAVLDNPAVVSPFVDTSATLVRSYVEDCGVETSILV